MKIKSLDKKLNIFMEMIYNKVNYTVFSLFKSIRYERKVKKFRKTILNCSPSLDLLWDMAEFIKLAEVTFFYDNSLKNSEFGLYSSRNFTPAQNGFKVYIPSQCRITVKLFSDEQRVCVEIERLKGEGGKTILSFINGDWEENHTVYDEMLLEQVIKFITAKIIYLFDYCYENR